MIFFTSALDLINKLIKDQRIRFLIVGGINTCLGYSMYAFLVYSTNGRYLLANVLTTLVCTSISYILYKYFTFKKHEKSIPEVFRFIGVYLVSFIMSNIVLLLLIECMAYSPYLAGAINLVNTTLISWFGHKYFSFKDEEG